MKQEPVSHFLYYDYCFVNVISEIEQFKFFVDFSGHHSENKCFQKKLNFVNISKMMYSFLVCLQFKVSSSKGMLH